MSKGWGWGPRHCADGLGQGPLPCSRGRGGVAELKALTPGSIAGKDATQDFEEIGHSKSANKLLEKYIIGLYEVRAPIRWSGSRHAASARACAWAAWPKALGWKLPALLHARGGA